MKIWGHGRTGKQAHGSFHFEAVGEPEPTAFLVVQKNTWESAVKRRCQKDDWDGKMALKPRYPWRQAEEWHQGLLRLCQIALLATFLCFSLTIPAAAQAPESSMHLPAEQLLEFAHYLYSQQEYFRAIGEYQRFLFLYPDHFQADNAALRIAQCYQRGKRWQQALEAVDAFFAAYPQSPLRWEARFLKANVLNNLGKGEGAREEYRAIIEERPGQPLVAEAWYLIGLSYAKDGRWLEADQALSRVGSEDFLHGEALEMRQIVAEESEKKPKDPALAGLLAGVLPGSGHLYCKRPRDAALAFVFTGGFAWATYEAFNQDNDGLGVVLALITAAFYGGNIYSAVNVAHKYNDREQRRREERFAPYERLGFGQPPATSLGFAMKLYF